MRGVVVKTSGVWYTVRSEEGTLETCAMKGNFRMRGIRSTTPVAVGDNVVFADGFINEVEDRKNYIVRKSINLSKESHILAANIDQVVLVATINHPITSTTFIDRLLANAEAYDIPAVLVFNKIDLYDDDDKTLLEAMTHLYNTVGYTCVPISAETGCGLDKLKDLLCGKITLFSGHSGVGKTTLINRIIPNLGLRTAEISDMYDTGKHTTTYSEMFEIPLKHYSAIIDTPGIKGFGTFDMEKEDVGDYFKEIFQYSKDCKFNNCTHTHEPGCAVLQALENHDIAESRYKSYLSIMADKNESKYR